MEKQTANPDNECVLVYAAASASSVAQMVAHGRKNIALVNFEAGNMRFIRMEFAERFDFDAEPPVHNACLYIFRMNVHGLTPFYKEFEHDPFIIEALKSGAVDFGPMAVLDHAEGEIPLVSKAEIVLRDVVFLENKVSLSDFDNVDNDELVDCVVVYKSDENIRCGMQISSENAKTLAGVIDHDILRLKELRAESVYSKPRDAYPDGCLVVFNIRVMGPPSLYGSEALESFVLQALKNDDIASVCATALGEKDSFTYNFISVTLEGVLRHNS